MQCTTVGLAGIHNPELLTVHTEARKVRYRQGRKKYGRRGWTTMSEQDYVHSLALLWSVMSGFGESINTKHTVWLRAVVIDYLANCSSAISICPIFKIQQLCPMHQYTVTCKLSRNFLIFILLYNLLPGTFINDWCKSVFLNRSSKYYYIYIICYIMLHTKKLLNTIYIR